MFASNAEVPDLDPVETDSLLILRDGQPFLRTPVHDLDAKVPEDFLILLAIATAWHDPGFRKMMKQVIAEATERGLLEGVIHAGDPDGRPN